MTAAVELNIPNVFEPLYSDNESAVFVITGGRYSAKTHNITQWAVLEMMHSKYFHCIVTRYNFGTIRDSLKSAIEKQINALGVKGLFEIKTDRIICKSNENIIVFCGLKKAELTQQKGKGFDGFNVLVVDEAQEWVDQDSFWDWFRSIRVKMEGIQNKRILVLNPTHRTHWIHERFYEREKIPDGYNGIDHSGVKTRYIHSTYRVCEKYLPDDILDELRDLKERDPKSYNCQVEGGWYDDNEKALFRWEWINRNRVDSVPYYKIVEAYGLREVIVIIDPAAEGDKDRGHDKHGILTMGIDNNDVMYIISDKTMHGTPAEAAHTAINEHKAYKASCVVAEDNNGGKWIPTVFNQINRFIDVRCVKASQGKIARMQPAAAYCERGMIKFIGTFPELEGQLCSYSAESGQKSPNNYDCLAWGYHYFSGKYGSRVQAGFATGLM